MRIFCAVRHSIDPKFYYGALWSGNFYPALRQLGYEIVELQVDLLPLSRFMHIASNFTRQELEARARTTEQILDEVRTAHQQRPVNLFLSYFYNAHFDPSGFDELRRLGIPSVNFYCNSIYQFPFVSEIAAKVDFSWHAERDARNSYLEVGANPVWVQMAADPEVYHAIPNIRKKAAACFVGQKYADRDQWMATLIQGEIPVDIYGPGWSSMANGDRVRTTSSDESEYLGRARREPGSFASYVDVVRSSILRGGATGVVRLINQWRYRHETRKLAPLFTRFAKGPISFEKIAEVFARYEVCLNLSNVWADGRPGSALIPHIRLRDFEGPMCRTCYLTGHTDEIEEFYDVGREIETYRTPDELVDKTRFYLGKPAAAESLRAAGYARARRDHTWIRRFDELFAKIAVNLSKSSTISLAI